MLKIQPTGLNEVLILEYDVNKDNRAVFHRTFSRELMLNSGILTEFTEEISYHPMKKNTLYGIHFQNHPKAQAKLLYCAKGRILDFAIDLRKNSSTYKKWISIELTEDNRKQLYIPHGFGHAALTLEDNSNIVMRIDNAFDTSLSRAIRYDDKDINLNITLSEIILSKQDTYAPFLVDSDCNL